MHRPNRRDCPGQFGHGHQQRFDENVCSINAAGANNKYMVSTYSLPKQIASPQGGGWVYTCSSENSDGAYAQCDGGLCFRSTKETTFPGFDKRVPKGQIM